MTGIVNHSSKLVSLSGENELEPCQQNEELLIPLLKGFVSKFLINIPSLLHKSHLLPERIEEQLALLQLIVAVLGEEIHCLNSLFLLLTTSTRLPSVN